MNSTQYKEEVKRVECDYDKPAYMMTGHRQQRMLHVVLGLQTESGELADVVKKHIFKQRPIDEVNLAEETGDILWYIAVLCDEFGWTFEELMDLNIKKLKSRYPTAESVNTEGERDQAIEQALIKAGLNKTL